MATVTGTNQSDIIDAADGVTEGNDTIFGLGGADTIFGLGGNDTIDCGTGNDTINGGAGSDTIDGGAGADAIDGGTGFDTAVYTQSTQGVSVSLALGRGFGGFAQGDTLANIDDLIGSAFNDVLIGNTGANRLLGGDGQDTLSGGDGNDQLFGELGNDVLIGGDGNDLLVGGAGADDLIGGEGHDTVRYDESGAGVTVDLASGNGSGGTAQGDTFDSIDNALGSTFDDQLIGNDDTNLLNGLAGNDVLKGAGGSDTLFGNLGNDVLKGGGGADLLFGESGEDSLIGNEGDDLLDGGADVDTMTGGTGDDVMVVDNTADVVNEAIGEGLDTVRTSATYVLKAGAEVEILETNNRTGTTTLDLVGNEFGNTITGNDGNNAILGSITNDGGGFDGQDVMTGRAGSDLFIWTSLAESSSDGNLADVITDFNRGAGDLISISTIDADATLAGDQAFAFVGATNFTAAGQLAFFTTATDTFLVFNTDNDFSTVEMAIRLVGVQAVDASFFV